MTSVKSMPEYLSVLEAKFLNPGFEFWFSNHEHIRTPFPGRVLSELKNQTTAIYTGWLKGLKEEELNQMPDHEFAEMFETILFNEALKLVDSDDERISVVYPFMPRIGDIVNHSEHGKGEIIERKEILNHENKKVLEVTISCQNNTVVWKTQFELIA